MNRRGFIAAIAGAFGVLKSHLRLPAARRKPWGTLIDVYAPMFGTNSVVTEVEIRQSEYISVSLTGLSYYENDHNRVWMGIPRD